MATQFGLVLSPNRFRLLFRQIFRSNSSIKPSNMSGEASGLLKVLEQSPKRLKRIQFLGELFKSHGFELRIAGGAVRDILRGKEPQDIDFATTARPEDSLAIVSKHEDLLRIIVTAAGQRHGTVAVKFKETDENDLTKRVKLTASTSSPTSIIGQQLNCSTKPEYDGESPYEITTLRCDKITDGRHAEVEFINDWRKDAERRDLTINAMFLTLDEGKLIDYFGGERDLNEGIVRFVGDAELRIKEDYLRILRFFRFWSRYSKGRQPDDETLMKLKSNLDGLNQISGERIWQEIKKTLSHLPCRDVTKLMLQLRVFDYAGLKDDDIEDYENYINNVIAELDNVQQNVEKFLRDILKPRLEKEPEDQANKRLQDLLPVILFATTVQSETLCLNSYKRVKFSNLERDTILYIIQNRDKDPPISSYKYQLAMAPRPERPLVMQRIKAFLVFKGRFELIEQLEAWQVPNFPLSGTIVSKAIKECKLPGNKTKDVLSALKLEWAQKDYKPSGDELVVIMQEKLNEMTKNEDK